MFCYHFYLRASCEQVLCWRRLSVCHWVNVTVAKQRQRAGLRSPRTRVLFFRLPQSNLKRNELLLKRKSVCNKLLLKKAASTGVKTGKLTAGYAVIRGIE